MREYTVHMQWDSYEGSLFVETHTGWYYTYSQDQAYIMARNQHGHKNGFKITN